MALDMAAMANRIAVLRKERGLTQEELGARLGVSGQAVSKWERGLSLPDVEMLTELADQLSQSVDGLLGRATERNALRQTVYDLGALSLQEQWTEPVLVTFGIGVSGWITEEHLAAYGRLRVKILRETGVLIPMIRLRDEPAMDQYELHVHLFGELVLKCEAADERLVEELPEALRALVMARLSRFVNRHMVKILVDDLREQTPFLVEGVVPERIGLSRLTCLLRRMVAAGHSIRDLGGILTALDEEVEDDAALERAYSALCKALGFGTGAARQKSRQTPLTGGEK